MTVRMGVNIVTGLIVFTLAGLFLTNLITGTDSGSTLLQGVLLIVCAAILLINLLTGIGKRK